VFSSDLSVDEAIALREAGFEPRRMVMGTSMFHIGVTWGNWGNMEIRELSAAMTSARNQAMARMLQQLQACGGDGVVGVRLEIRMHHAAHSIAEFVAMGTAVRVRDEHVARLRGIAFTSDLSGQDLYLLVRAGYRPVGMVMGCCVYHVGRQGLMSLTANVEMTTYTEALYDARELAMERMQHDARRVGADGVVGVSVTEKTHAWGSRAIEFLAVGTAVRELEGGHQRLGVVPVVPMQDDASLTDPSRITGE
jgi:uncharacterized protein YbjQ (UPF0145 family)